MAGQHHTARQGWGAIVAHPLCATGVYVWFGAAFALSTLAVRGELLEQLVLKSQLDLVLTLASPPLGMTARLLVALVFGLIGVGFGWLAMKVLRRAMPATAARPRAMAPVTEPVAPVAVKEAVAKDTSARRRSRDAHPDAPARRPIFAHEELGDEGFDSPIERIADPIVSRFGEVYAAPVFETAPIAAEPITVEAPAAGIETADVTPVEARPVEAAPVEAAMPPVAGTLPAEQTPAEQTVAVRKPAGFPTASGPTAAERIAGASLDSLSHIELIERLAIVMQRHRETPVSTPAPSAPVPPTHVAPTDSVMAASVAPAPVPAKPYRSAMGIDAAALRRRIEDMPSFNPHGAMNGDRVTGDRVNGDRVPTPPLPGPEASLRAALASLQEIR